MTGPTIPSGRAAVMTGPGRTEVRDEPAMPLDPDGAVLRVLSAGVCGSDVAYYRTGTAGDGPYHPPPLVLGHEIVGRLEWMGSAADRWDLEVGDVVVLSPVIYCGSCAACRRDDTGACTTQRFYGMDAGPGWPTLRGGNAQFLDVHPNSQLYRVPDEVPAHLASLFVPVANGIDWVQNIGRVTAPETVVVIGPGQHGLGCVLAARDAGATAVILAGLRKDTERLAVGASVGATHVVDVSAVQLSTFVADVTEGRMADVVVEVSGSTAGRDAAVEVVTRRGRILLAGITGGKQTTLDFDRVVRNRITIQGVHAHAASVIPTALESIRAHQHVLASMLTHLLPLAEVDAALRMSDNLEGAIHVAIDPWASGS